MGSDTDWDNVECGHDFTLAIKTNGVLYGTGYNANGELGLNDTTNRNTFTQIAGTWNDDAYRYEPLFCGGRNHSLAINDSDAMSATGDNVWGQLALGDSGAGTDRDEFAAVVESYPPDFEADTWQYTRCGEHHTMALKVVAADTTEYPINPVWTMPD